MKYPIAIEPGNATTAWGVVVPDLPGCFSAADSGIDEAIENAKQSIALWIETALDAGQSVPPPSTITTLQKQRAYKGWIWAIAEVSPELLSDEIERVNISLPKRVGTVGRQSQSVWRNPVGLYRAHDHQRLKC